MRAASALLLASLILTGCSLTKRHPEKPEKPEQPTASIPSGSAVPSPPPDVLTIPDAVPRVEPRGTRGREEDIEASEPEGRREADAPW